ncbi:hypothetical protein LP414_27340 [Polaromonas sp. P1(28)-13]|nr:hypothetical protein LP414_27340 [Polaromonas sp. P1(28)-13]
MNSKDYQAGVLSTESAPKSLEINQISLHAVLTMVIAASEVADLVKRRLYYGKPIPDAGLQAQLTAVSNMANFLIQGQEFDPAAINARMVPAALEELAALPEEIRGMDLDKVNIRLLHASLGMFTESGELLKAMLKQYETGTLDKTNFGEELGDADWYKMVAHDETGVSEEDSRTLNNRKLLDKAAGRYKSGAFTADQAVNRDLAAERTILASPADMNAPVK